MEEEVLAGGNSTEVVRRGDTVLRTAGPWTPAVHTLLRTLRSAGISEVPVPRGVDEQDREVLSFIPGEVAHYPLPDWVWAPEILTDSARLLRRIHDASTALAGAPLTWQLPTHQPVEVVCHNDVALYNLVFRDRRLVGVIDFDTASPGPRIWDLAYLAYRVVPFVDDAGGHAPDGPERPARLELLIDAYGWPYSRREVLLVMADRLTELAQHSDEQADRTGRTDLHEHSAMYRRDRDVILQLGSSL